MTKSVFFVLVFTACGAPHTRGAPPPPAASTTPDASVEPLEAPHALAEVPPDHVDGELITVTAAGRERITQDGCEERVIWNQGRRARVLGTTLDAGHILVARGRATFDVVDLELTSATTRPFRVLVIAAKIPCANAPLTTRVVREHAGTETFRDEHVTITQFAGRGTLTEQPEAWEILLLNGEGDLEIEGKPYKLCQLPSNFCEAWGARPSGGHIVIAPHQRYTFRTRPRDFVDGGFDFEVVRIYASTATKQAAVE